MEKDDQRELAENKLLILINKIFSISKEDKLKVNLATTNALMTSNSYKGLSEENYNKVVAFRRQLLHKDAVRAHKEIFCRKKQKEIHKLDIQLECQICGIITPDKELGKRIVEDPSTSAEAKGTLPKTGVLLKKTEKPILGSNHFWKRKWRIYFRKRKWSIYFWKRKWSIFKVEHILLKK